ncbi:DUF3822 family protein [Hyunsoonleella rubra]|uniref:DUF3822 family protein n=1 Tax=Hyunsoonleella rubra TaxID=1737062 RepID=A0ABW5TB46_9FLAO
MTPKKSNSSNTLSNHKLSIQISLSGLSFCILHTTSNTITSIKEIKFDKKVNPFEALDQLKALFESEEALQNTFDDIQLIHENDLSTLVPKPLFNEDFLADYLKFNSKILKSDFITYDPVDVNNCMNVYVPYVNINNYIYSKFGEFTYKHFSTILIEQILKQEKGNDTKRMYVNVCDSHFEVIVLDKEKLKLYNTFDYKNPEDFIYYILFTSEQLELDPETFDLVFLGNIEEGDSLYEIAHKYIRHLSFGKRNDGYNYSKKPATDYSHFTLINSF